MAFEDFSESWPHRMAYLVVIASAILSLSFSPSPFSLYTFLSRNS